MQVTREYLLELDRKRIKMEQEIMSLTEFLNSEGMPGVDGRLIDNEGFPIQNVDIMAVRTARNKLIILQNDLKNLMSTIEQNMAVFFKNEQENKRIYEAKKEVEKEEPIVVSVFEDQPKKTIQLKIPFAWIANVSEGSPAEEAGLKSGDGVINFDGTVYYGIYHNPLQKIAEIVGKKIGKEIPVEIVRKFEDGNGEEISEYLNITLIPHTWTGQGVLGCKLNLS